MQGMNTQKPGKKRKTNRQREPAKRACTPCSRAKRRCDGQRPCARCAARNRTEQCEDVPWSERAIKRMASGKANGKKREWSDTSTTQATGSAVEVKKAAVWSHAGSTPKCSVSSTTLSQPVASMPDASAPTETFSENPERYCSSSGYTTSQNFLQVPGDIPIDSITPPDELNGSEYIDQVWNDVLSTNYTKELSLGAERLHYTFDGQSYNSSSPDNPLQTYVTYVSLGADGLAGDSNFPTTDIAQEDFLNSSDAASDLFAKEDSIQQESPVNVPPKQFLSTSDPGTSTASSASSLNQLGGHNIADGDDMQEGRAMGVIKRCLYTTLSASPIPCCRITYDSSTFSLTSVFFNKPCCQLFGLDSDRMRRLMYLSKEMSWVPPNEVESRVVKGYLKAGYNRLPTIMYWGRYLRNVSSPDGDPSVDSLAAEVDTDGRPKRYTFQVYEACVANEIEWHSQAGAVSRTIWYTQPRFTGETVELDSFSSVWADTYRKLRNAVSDEKLSQIGYYISPMQPIVTHDGKAAFPRKDRPVFDALNGFYEIVDYSTGPATSGEAGVSVCGNRYTIEKDPQYLMVKFQTVGAGDAFAPLDRLASTVASAGVRIPVMNGRIQQDNNPYSRGLRL
eukprot:gb/GECG01002134.1/.p1 GENE.gb/GECG01002134.1/~~gb/GECG01002134.1/.p1  ORF type:complete len:620 (+),score=63.55 gb/GECG01002134.1/:1-1860(+)